MAKLETGQLWHQDGKETKNKDEIIISAKNAMEYVFCCNGYFEVLSASYRFNKQLDTSWIAPVSKVYSNKGRAETHCTVTSNPCELSLSYSLPMIFSPLFNMSDTVCLISSEMPLVLLLLSQFRPSEVLRAVSQQSEPFFWHILSIWSDVNFALCFWNMLFFFPLRLVDGGCCSRTDRPTALSEKQKQAGGAALYVLGKDLALCNNGLLLWGSFDHFLCFLSLLGWVRFSPGCRALSVCVCVRVHALHLKHHVKSQYWITCCSLCVQLQLHLRRTDQPL